MQKVQVIIIFFYLDQCDLDTNLLGRTNDLKYGEKIFLKSIFDG